VPGTDDRTGDTPDHQPHDEAGEPGRSSDDQLGGPPSPPAVTLTRTARFALGATIAIVLGVIVLVVVAVTARPAARNTIHQASAPAAVVAAVSDVPTAVFDAVGDGPARMGLVAPTVFAPPAPVREGGRPAVLYLGAEYCTFCAAERWPLVVALSRFGRFTRLDSVTSSSTSVFPAIQSFTFSGAVYTSPYVALSATEQYSNVRGPGGGFERLGDPPRQDRAALAQAGRVAGAGMPQGTLPVVDVAGIEALATAQLSPAVLASEPLTTVASQLTDPSAPATQAIVAAANQLTAGICTATGQLPAAVCTSPGVRQADAALGLPQP
jgi:hypothetical protein